MKQNMNDFLDALLTPHPMDLHTIQSETIELGTQTLKEILLPLMGEDKWDDFIRDLFYAHPRVISDLIPEHTVSKFREQVATTFFDVFYNSYKDGQIEYWKEKNSYDYINTHLDSFYKSCLHELMMADFIQLQKEENI